MGMENNVDFEAMAESEVKEESKEEIKYGIGTIINDYEDWLNFVEILNTIRDEDAEPVDPGVLNINDDQLPNFVALDTFTMAEFKQHFDNNDLTVKSWSDVERLAKLMDAGYLITLGRV